MDYQGVIIEESLVDTDVFKNVKILSTKYEMVTDKRKTPWLRELSKWTLHTVEIKEKDADTVAKELSLSLNQERHWYADYKNDTTHYIVFKNKIFKINHRNKQQYEEAKQYGISVGIPEQDIEFLPEIK